MPIFGILQIAIISKKLIIAVIVSYFEYRQFETTLEFFENIARASEYEIISRWCFLDSLTSTLS